MYHNAAQLMAQTQASMDWQHGASFDNNPYPKDTVEARAWDNEFERLDLQAELRESQAPADVQQQVA